MEGILLGRKGNGFDIKGIIERYKAQNGTINAGDFVDFIRYTTSSPADLDSTTYSGQKLFIDLMTNNRILLLHNGSNSIMATVLDVIEDDIIIVENKETGIDVNNFGGYAKINNNHYIITYGQGNECVLFGMIFKINEDGTAEVGNPKQLSASSYSGLTSSPIALSETSVLIINNYSSSTLNLYATACTIDTPNLTILTYSSNNSICTGMLAGQTGNIVKISDKKAFVTCSYLVNGSIGSYVMGYIVNVNGTSVTKYTTTIYSTANDSSYRTAGMTMINDGSYGLIGHLAYVTDGDTDVMIRVFSVNNNTLTTYQGVTISNVGTNRKMYYLNKTDYGLFVYSPSANNTLRCRVVRRNSDNTVKVGHECVLSTDANSGRFFDVYSISVGTILVCHSYTSNSNLRGQVFVVDFDEMLVKAEAVLLKPNVQTATSIPFDGVALTGGADGEEVKVAVPDVGVSE